MGWLNLSPSNKPAPTKSQHPLPQAQKDQSQYQKYTHQDPSTPDSDLPYIDPECLCLIEEHSRVSASNSNPPYTWIVIDNIVYDCTEFQNEHPGGVHVIRAFTGQDCSWQFWRFHGREQMEGVGKRLRIGRTEGVKNRFVEMPRYVGLDLGGDYW